LSGGGGHDQKMEVFKSELGCVISIKEHAGGKKETGQNSYTAPIGRGGGGFNWDNELGTPRVERRTSRLALGCG